jgi:hypothetical protein
MIMDSLGIVGILLFVVPGMLVQKIDSLLSIPKRDKKSDFGLLVESVFLSFPVVAVTVIIYYIAYRFRSVANFESLVQRTSTLMVFCAILIAVTVVWGILKSIIHPYFYCLINGARSKLDRFETSDESCWSNLFFDDNKYHCVKIVTRGTEYFGFVEHVSLPNEDHEIILNRIDDAVEHKDCFTQTDRIYINFDKDLAIYDYDTRKYDAICDQSGEDAETLVTGNL